MRPPVALKRDTVSLSIIKIEEKKEQKEKELEEQGERDVGQASVVPTSKQLEYLSTTPLHLFFQSMHVHLLSLYFF